MIDRHIARLRAHRDELAACIREAILRETPAYGRLHGAEAVAWAKGIDDALGMFLDAGIVGRAPTPGERAALEAIGRARAEQDVPLDAISASIAVAARVVRDWPLEHSGSLTDDDRRALSLLSERATTFANTITSVALRAYVARKEELATSLEQAKARLFDRVLSGRFDSEPALVREGQAVGCDLTKPWVVVAIPTASDRLSDLLEAEAVASLPSAVVVPMGTAAEPHTALVMPVPDDDSWQATRHVLERLVRAHHSSLLRVGPHLGAERLQRSYQAARSLVPHVDRLTAVPSLVDAADHRDTALLATVPAAIRDGYAAEVLGAIEREPKQRARRLLRTLEVLVQCDSLKAAAKVLGVSGKTVSRRVELVERLSGLQLDQPEHLHRARTAVTLRRLSVDR